MWNLIRVYMYISRDVELSNFITCPWTSKWSKSTCPTKIYLPENWHFFFFSYFSKKTYVVGTHQKRLTVCCGYSSEAPHRGASDEYPQHMFSSRNKKNIYLIRGHPRSFYILYIFTSPSSQDREVSQLRETFSPNRPLGWPLSYNLDTLLPELWITCPRTSKLKFLTCPQGNGTSWTSQAWYFHSSVHCHLSSSFLDTPCSRMDWFKF